MFSFFKNQSTESRRKLILHGPILGTIVILSIPTLLMGVVMSAMPLIDSFFINRTAGTVIAGSVIFSQPIIVMVTALSQGLAIAATAIIGQHNGLGNFNTAKKISVQVVVFGAVVGLIVSPFLPLIGHIISGSLIEDIRSNVFLYLSLSSFYMPFMFLAAIYNGIKNASGKPEAVFIRIFIMLILKILFNTIFLLLLDLGIVGSVVSTVCVYIIVTAWMYHDLFIKDSDDKLSLKSFKFDFGILKEITVIGIPSMINIFLVNFGFYLINMEVEKYGAAVLNAQGIAVSINAICFNLPSSFASTVTTIVSMNIGAGYVDKAKKSCLVGCILGFASAILLTIAILPFSMTFVEIFTKEPDVVFIANTALHIFTYSVAGFAVCMVIQGALIGLGKTRITLVLGMLRIWAFRYLFVLFTSKYLSYYSVFWGNLVSNYLAAIVAIIIILNIKWESAINTKDASNLRLRFNNWFKKGKVQVFKDKKSSRDKNKDKNKKVSVKPKKTVKDKNKDKDKKNGFFGSKNDIKKNNDKKAKIKKDYTSKDKKNKK